MLSFLNHPNIISYRAYLNNHIYLEYASGGNLAEIPRKLLSSYVIAYFVHEILKGLEYLH